MSSYRFDTEKSCRVSQLCGLRWALVVMVVATGSAQAFAQIECPPPQKLMASDGAEFDGFGRSASISGDVAAIGASGVDCAADEGCGAAYMFRFDGTSWIQEEELVASDADVGDLFGETISLSGDTVWVGADRDDCMAGISCGAAYVFQFDGSTWVEKQKITAPNPDHRDFFGTVSVSGDWAVVGARGVDCAVEGEENCGSAYAYHYDGSSWNLSETITASDATVGDSFGQSVSISGDTAIFGAEGVDCGPGTNCGAAYVLRFDGTDWIEEQKLIAGDGAEGDQFGEWVSIAGDTAIVGAPRKDCAEGERCGAAYVFRFDGTTWIQEQKLTAAEASRSAWFGRAVSISGDTAVLGSIEGFAGSPNCGAAYVFRFDGATWFQERKLPASCTPGDKFGGHVSLNGHTALIGAVWAHCEDGTRCGAAFVYDVSPCGACCHTDSTCTSQTETGCSEIPDATYLGVGTDCTTNLCDVGPCCFGDGSCTEEIRGVCVATPDNKFHDSGNCQGDNNGNNIDERCEVIIPTTSEWGLMVLALALLIVGTQIIKRGTTQDI